MPGFSLEEAIGKQPPAQSGGFSLEEAQGKPAAKPVPKAEELPAPLKAAVNLGKNAADLFDLAVSLPGQLSTEITYGLQRGADALRGVDTQKSIQARGAEKAAAQDVLTVGGRPEARPEDASLVAKGMGKISEKIDAFATSIEKGSQGRVSREDAAAIANLTLLGFGGRAVKGAGKLAGKAGGLLKPGEVPVEAAPVPEPKPQQPTPPSMAKQHIERTLGITDQKAAAKAQKLRRAEARAAFQEDPQYADYLRNYAEEEVRQRGLREELPGDRLAPRGEPPTSRSRLSEPFSLEDALKKGEEPSKGGFPPSADEIAGGPALDRALGKLGKNQGFDLSAEEKIALRDMQLRPRQIIGKQSGAVQQELLANMALVGIGGMVGAYLDPDSPIQGAVLGALAGVGLTRVTPENLRGAYKALTTKDTRLRVDKLADTHEGTMATAYAKNAAFINNLIKELPDVASREKVFAYLDDPQSVVLNKQEKAWAEQVRAAYNRIGQEAQATGVIKGMRENYATHIVDLAQKDPNFFEQLFGTKNLGMSAMSAKSPYGKARTFGTVKELEAAGFKLKTKDMAEVWSLYSNSMIRATVNARFMEGLKAAKDPATGKSLLVAVDKAPPNYVSVNHPQLQGFRVHPDIEPSVKFLFDTKTPDGMMKALEVANTVSKMSKVAFSTFHAVSLIEGQAGALGWAKAGRNIGRLAMGRDGLLNQLRNEGAGDMIDLGLKNGLKITTPRGELVGDVRTDVFINTLKATSKFLDDTIPGLGKPVAGVAKLQHAFDQVMWERLQTAGKLNIFADKFAELKRNNIRAYEKNPGKVKLLDDDTLAKSAASFANDVQGGINWRRIAEGVQNRFGRDLALKAMSPSGQRVLRLAFFAPDWLMATTRGLTKALGPGTGVEGLMRPQTLADLHRQYQLRSAFWYVMAAEGIQYSQTGHHIWENKDPTKVWLDDHHYMRLSKHFTDPYELAISGGGALKNKLGAVPNVLMQEGASLAKTGEMSTKPVVEQFTPFAAGAGGAGGALGFPVYGMSPEERRAAKRKAAQEQKALRKKRKQDKEHFE